VVLTSTAGVTLASAEPNGHGDAAGPALDDDDAGDRSMPIHVEVPVRGIPSARLTLYVRGEADVNLARIAGNRSVDILALALLQRMPPGLKEMAGAALIRAIDSGKQNWRLQELAPAAGIPVSAQVVAVVVRSSASKQLRRNVEHLLDPGGQYGASYADNAELLALGVLRSGNAQNERQKIVDGLMLLEVPEGTVSAVGPVASGISFAPWSLSEARLTLELAVDVGTPAAAGKLNGTVLDAQAFAVERMAVQSIDEAVRRDFVNQQLAAVLEHDAQRHSQLVKTLRVWLDSGCNTAQAARELHVERQSMHQRLQRIFSLCGGDPRGTGRLPALHLATRLAALQQG
jgi:purine catabolism regulator